jgi:serine protease Do
MQRRDGGTKSALRAVEAFMRSARRWFLCLAVLAVAPSAVLSPQAAQEQATSDVPNVFRAIARQRNPTVVAIKTTTWLDPAAEDEADWFERFFGRTLSRDSRVRREAATGFLISSDGDILTNDHVVADADIIEVRLLGQDATTYRATLVGRDPISDSAVIRLVRGPSNLPVAALGDSDSLEAGDWVMAIGNPYQLGHSVTVGVVSYVGRSFEIREGRWQNLIQTDASINPGSSGGPLLNARGEVIGISLAALADGLGDTMGIGFAVPINNVKAVLPALRSGRVIRGNLAVQLRHTTLTDEDAKALGLPDARGALITAVTRGSSAEVAGFLPGDVIVEFLGAPVASADDVLTRVSSATPGIRARAAVVRDGRTRGIDVTVEAFTIPSSPRKHRVPEEPCFGLTFADLESESGPADGSLVEGVERGSAAAAAGFEPGDVIRKINMHTIRTAADAQRELQRIPTGSTVFLLVRQDGEDRIVEMEKE